jgi:hypothetical protein
MSMAAKKKTTKKSSPPTPIRREDRPGHLDPKYAASLHALSGSSDTGNDRAFVRGRHSGDDLAEELAEEAVVAMTSGEDGLAEDLQGAVEEELGGPFVTSTGGKEFADGTDASNPIDADREPFPKT